MSDIRTSHDGDRYGHGVRCRPRRSSGLRSRVRRGPELLCRECRPRHGLIRLRRSLILPALACLACGGEARSDRDSPALSTAALEDTLMRRIEAAYDFSRPGVVERMSALYPDTGRVISASGGYITTSVDALHQGLADFWANVGVNMSDPRWEWGDVHVDRLSADAAVLTAAWSIPHMAPTGRPHTIRGAWTAVFRRMDRDWVIIQEHLSVPPEGP